MRIVIQRAAHSIVDTGGSGGWGACLGRAGAMVGYGGEGCGQEGFGGGLTALMTEASTQTQRIATTVMIVSKLSVRAASTAGHSIRMSKQFVAWRRDAGQSEEGWRWGWGGRAQEGWRDMRSEGVGSEIGATHFRYKSYKTAELS